MPPTEYIFSKCSFVGDSFKYNAWNILDNIYDTFTSFLKHEMFCFLQKKVSHTGFRMTWGRVNNNRIFILIVNCPFKQKHTQCKHNTSSLIYLTGSLLITQQPYEHVWSPSCPLCHAQESDYHTPSAIQRPLKSNDTIQRYAAIFRPSAANEILLKYCGEFNSPSFQLMAAGILRYGTYENYSILLPQLRPSICPSIIIPWVPESWQAYCRLTLHTIESNLGSELCGEAAFRAWHSWMEWGVAGGGAYRQAGECWLGYQAVWVEVYY